MQHVEAEMSVLKHAFCCVVGSLPVWNIKAISRKRRRATCTLGSHNGNVFLCFLVQDVAELPSMVTRPWQAFDHSDKYEEACVVDCWRNGRPVGVLGTR